MLFACEYGKTTAGIRKNYGKVTAKWRQRQISGGCWLGFWIGMDLCTAKLWQAGNLARGGPGGFLSLWSFASIWLCVYGRWYCLGSFVPLYLAGEDWSACDGLERVLPPISLCREPFLRWGFSLCILVSTIASANPFGVFCFVQIPPKNGQPAEALSCQIFCHFLISPFLFSVGK